MTVINAMLHYSIPNGIDRQSSVKVSEVITGSVASNFASRNPRELPPTSLYLPIADGFAQYRSMSEKGAMDTAAYAKDVVKHMNTVSPYPSKFNWITNESNVRNIHPNGSGSEATSGAFGLSPPSSQERLCIT